MPLTEIPKRFGLFDLAAVLVPGTLLAVEVLFIPVVCGTPLKDLEPVELKTLLSRFNPLGLTLVAIVVCYVLGLGCMTVGEFASDLWAAVTRRGVWELGCPRKTRLKPSDTITAMFEQKIDKLTGYSSQSPEAEFDRSFLAYMFLMRLGLDSTIQSFGRRRSTFASLSGAHFLAAGILLFQQSVIVLGTKGATYHKSTLCVVLAAMAIAFLGVMCQLKARQHLRNMMRHRVFKFLAVPDSILSGEVANQKHVTAGED